LPHTPTTGTGRAASAALDRVIRALVRAMNPPPGRGYSTTGHVAIQLAGGRGIDINFGKHAAKILEKERINEARQLRRWGVSYAQIKELLFDMNGNVPFDTDMKAAATFEAAHGPDSRIPLAAREWYTHTLSQISGAHLDIAINILENSTHVGCTPLAILKERKGLGTAIVGKLGFRNPNGGPITDWEYGGNGIAWR